MDVNPIVRYLNTLKKVGSIKNSELGFLTVYVFLNHLIEHKPIDLSKNEIGVINSLFYCLSKKSCLLSDLKELECPKHEDEAFYFYYAIVNHHAENEHAINYITINDLIKSQSLIAQMSMIPGSRFIVLFDEQVLSPIEYRISTSLGDDVGNDLFNKRTFYKGYKLINGTVYTSIELLYYNTSSEAQTVNITFEKIKT